MGILKKARDSLREPLLDAIDIDGDERIATHRRILQSKPGSNSNPI